MKKVLFLAIFVSLALTGVYTVITLYDSTMKAGRLYQTQVIRSHEEPQLLMDKRSITYKKSEALVKENLSKEKLTKETLKTMVPATLAKTDKAMLAKGEKDYKAFCSHCHGDNLDGLGTVGQSFFPLPTNLIREKTVSLSDQELFYLISYGSKKTPALASSMSVESRKAVILYIRFMQKTTL
jgi:hypothetical protein